MARGILLVVAAVCTFTVLDSTAKWLTQFYPVAMVVWVRYAANALILLAWQYPRQGRALWRTRAPRLQAWRGLALAASTVFFFAALSRMPIAEAAAITFVGPVLVTLASVRFLGETAPRGTGLALAVSFAGVLCIVRPGSALFSWTALLPLGTAVCYAAYQVLTRRLSGVDPPMTTLFLGAALGTALLSFVGPFHLHPLVETWHLLPLLATGAVGALGHWLLIRALDHAPASTLAPYVYFQIVAALLSGVLLFGQFPDALALAGMALVVTTGVVMALRQRAGR